jgi:hypothetical protein
MREFESIIEYIINASVDTFLKSDFIKHKNTTQQNLEFLYLLHISY